MLGTATICLLIRLILLSPPLGSCSLLEYMDLQIRTSWRNIEISLGQGKLSTDLGACAVLTIQAFKY